MIKSITPLFFALFFIPTASGYCQSSGVAFEISAGLGVAGISYKENPQPSDSLQITGDNLTIPIEASAMLTTGSYYLAASGTTDLTTFQGVESGRTQSQALNYIAQQNNVHHHYSEVNVKIGDELIGIFKPFATYRWTRFVSDHDNLQTGTTQGQLRPTNAPASTETVHSTHIGGGFMGNITIPFVGFAIKYEASALWPIASSVTNSQLGTTTWGEKSGGNLFTAMLRFEQTVGFAAVYLGGGLDYMHWTGGGSTGSYNSQTIIWPPNDIYRWSITAGAKIGI